MKRLSCNILIGNLVFDFVSEVEIGSAWDNLTDTAKIIIPRNVKLKDGGVLPQINKGSTVEINLGYDGELRTEFTGYVSRVSANLPIEIECEDKMWQLKQAKVSGAWRKVGLDELLNSILSGVATQAQEIDLGSFRFSEVSPAKVLEILKKNYGIRSFFRNKTLYIGLLHPQEPESYNYSFQENVVSNNLEYRGADDHKVKVKAVSLLPDGGKHEIELGDPDGEQRTLHYYDLSEQALRETAEAEKDKLRRDGYSGSLVVFGENLVQHGDVVTLTDADYPDREGSYQVEAVTTRFGSGGYRKEIKLGKRI